jgi:hypothetical protein
MLEKIQPSGASRIFTCFKLQELIQGNVSFRLFYEPHSSLVSASETNFDRNLTCLVLVIFFPFITWNITTVQSM